jgi:hypothetical protein
MFRRIGAFACVTIGLCAVLACDDASDAIENTITCADVCERYRDCLDDDYDVSACTDRCEADASSDEDKEARLEECDECIEDRSCTGAVFACAAECAGVIDP